MEQTGGKIPAYAWINLLGLEIPIAAVLWSTLFSNISGVNTVPYSINQFLFAAAWSVVIGTRIIHILKSPKSQIFRPDIQFTQSNVIIFCILAIIVASCGVWMMFFQLGIGIISYALLPFIFCLIYFDKGKSQAPQFSMSIYGALAFASAVPIPSFFYSLSRILPIPFYIPNPQAFFYPSIWALAGLACFINISRVAYCQHYSDNSNKAPSIIPFLGASLIFFIIYQMTFIKASDPEFWLFAFIGAGTAGMYYINQVRDRLSFESFYLFSWLSLLIPVPLAMLAIWSSF